MAVRCDDCHRRIVRTEAIPGPGGKQYGPKCGQARGLHPPRHPRARTPRPTPNQQQPTLFDGRTLMDLTKWPRLLVIGDPVTETQANEILIRTDNWLLSSNDKPWIAQAASLAGIELDLPIGLPKWDSLREFTSKHRVLDLHYLTNQRIASAWIGGPHGWCDWNGRIAAHTFNIGKWPDVEDVDSDWRKIAAAFPFLHLTAQLAPDEGNLPPVVEWQLHDGEVEMRTSGIAPITPHEVDETTVLTRMMPGGERGVDPTRLRQALDQIRTEGN